MVCFKRLQLGEEAATLVFIASGIVISHNQGYTQIQCAVPSQHGWISRAKLVRFGMLQLRTIPVYTGKSKRTIP